MISEIDIVGYISSLLSTFNSLIVFFFLGIIIIGVNNPYITNVSEAIVCNDIYESINWTTTFTRDDILNGYMYACAPSEFKKTVTYLPNLPVKSLLLFNSTFNGSPQIAAGGVWIALLAVTLNAFHHGFIKTLIMI